MNVSIEIHPSWLRQPDLLKRMLAACAALEVAAPTSAELGNGNGNGAPAENHRPESPAPAPTRTPTREPGEDFEDRDEDQDAPRDGRQLLGWSRKQQPDAMGELMSYGKRNGFASKIVSWNPDQVMAAWAHVRASRAQAQPAPRTIRR
jgi:hypothetical protein